GDRDETVCAQQSRGFRQLALTPDEAGDMRGQIAVRSGRFGDHEGLPACDGRRAHDRLTAALPVWPVYSPTRGRRQSAFSPDSFAAWKVTGPSTVSPGARADWRWPQPHGAPPSIQESVSRGLRIGLNSLLSLTATIRFRHAPRGKTPVQRTH